MREILFRGKRVDNGEWVYGWYCGKVCDDFFAPAKESAQIIENDTLFWYEVIPETVGQDTGLTDKNGAKIFDGDVVKKSWIYRYITGRGEEEKLNSFTGVVIFDRGQFGLSLDENMDFDEFIGESKSDDWTEVIGNIHDEPKDGE